MRIQNTLTAAIVLLATVVSTPAVANDVETLYQRAALGEQVAAIAPQIRDAIDATFAQHGDDHAPADALQDRITLTINSAFSTDAGEAAMLTELDRQLDEADRIRVLAWLESPLGMRILSAEQGAVHSSMAEYDAFLDEMANTPPSEQRLSVLKELDNTLGATEAGARLLMQLDLAISVAERGASDDTPLAWENLTDATIPSLSEYAAAVETHVLHHHLFAFRELSTREIKQYIAFASSPSGARYVLAVQRGLERALSNGTWQLAELLMRWRQSPEMIKTRLSS